MMWWMAGCLFTFGLYDEELTEMDDKNRLITMLVMLVVWPIFIGIKVNDR